MKDHSALSIRLERVETSLRRTQHLALALGVSLLSLLTLAATQGQDPAPDELKVKRLIADQILVGVVRADEIQTGPKGLTLQHGDGMRAAASISIDEHGDSRLTLRGRGGESRGPVLDLTAGAKGSLLTLSGSHNQPRICLETTGDDRAMATLFDAGGNEAIALRAGGAPADDALRVRAPSGAQLNVGAAGTYVHGWVVVNDKDAQKADGRPLAIVRATSINLVAPTAPDATELNQLTLTAASVSAEGQTHEISLGVGPGFGLFSAGPRRMKNGPTPHPTMALGVGENCEVMMTGTDGRPLVQLKTTRLPGGEMGAVMVDGSGMHGNQLMPSKK